MKLSQAFFNRATPVVARELLGSHLLRRRNGKTERYMIIETEAYDGPNDLACHAARGRRTKRTEVLFGKPGIIYIYFTYGMHWLLNIVTGPEGYPAGVLIRGIMCIDKKGTLLENIDGPARITKSLELDGSIHGKKLGERIGLWMEKGKPVKAKYIKSFPRIGVNYAGPIWSKKKWRFVYKVSKNEKK